MLQMKSKKNKISKIDFDWLIDNININVDSLDKNVTKNVEKNVDIDINIVFDVRFANIQKHVKKYSQCFW